MSTNWTVTIDCADPFNVCFLESGSGIRGRFAAGRVRELGWPDPEK